MAHHHPAHSARCILKHYQCSHIAMVSVMVSMTITSVTVRAVEALYILHAVSHGPPELYSLQQLYSSCRGSTALQLYSLYSLQHSTAPLWRAQRCTQNCENLSKVEGR